MENAEIFGEKNGYLKMEKFDKITNSDIIGMTIEGKTIYLATCHVIGPEIEFQSEFPPDPCPTIGNCILKDCEIKAEKIYCTCCNIQSKIMDLRGTNFNDRC